MIKQEGFESAAYRNHAVPDSKVLTTNPRALNMPASEMTPVESSPTMSTNIASVIDVPVEKVPETSAESR